MSLDEAPREVRRMAYAQERKERATGKWAPWRRASDEQIADAFRKTDSAFGRTNGWCRDVHTVWTNGWVSVNLRSIRATSLGIPVDHAFFRTALGDELLWKEKQRIKDELFGGDRMAIEVYPRTTDLVDTDVTFTLPRCYRRVPGASRVSGAE